MRAEHWLYSIPLRLRSLFRRRNVEQDLDDEMRYHLEQKTHQLIDRGYTPQDARDAAMRAMGGLEQRKEECRDARRVSLIEDFVQDVRYAMRLLARTPVITAVAILSLALGIGANTAIFSLVDTVRLRLLPVQKPEELVTVAHHSPGDSDLNRTFTYALWEHFRDTQDVFSGAFAWSSDDFDLAEGGVARPVSGLYASGAYFSTLGVQPAAGRLFSVQDDRRGCAPVAVLGYGFWQEHYGGASSAIGSSIHLNRHEFQIIGVSARGFHGTEVGNSYDVAVPVCSAAIFNPPILDHRSWWWLNIGGRVKPGITEAERDARLAAISAAVSAASVPATWNAAGQANFMRRQFTSTPAARGVSSLRKQYERPLDVLMAVVGLVLLIACANIASLMAARGAARAKEIAVRRALGASRMRLMRQLLTECVLLSAAGAALGLLFARWGAALLVRHLSTANDQVFLDISLDARVLAFTTIVAVFTAILFGALPALRSTRVSLTAAMRSRQDGPGDSSRRFRAGSWIVAAQVALSLVLLVAAGLFLHSFVNLITLDLGFDRSNVLLVNANLQVAGTSVDGRTAMYDEIEARLRALPGVISASRSVIAPMSGHVWNDDVEVDTPHPPKGEAAVVYMNFVSPDYFATMRMPLLAGRGFDTHDTKTSERVAVISRTMAERFFPGQDPIGKYFRVPPPSGKPVPPIQIVGLIPDSKYGAIREDTYAIAFFPVTQLPDYDNSETFELRSALPPQSLIPMVENAVAAINKSIPLKIHTLAERVDDSMVQERMLAVLSGFFGTLALLLATIGLYGAMSYAVGLRQSEFGIRRALGAQPREILRLAMREVGIVLAGGLLAGVLLSLAGVTLLENLLFGLIPYDATTMAAAIGVLSAVAIVAGYLPARRAMRVDPMVALRYE